MNFPVLVVTGCPPPDCGSLAAYLLAVAILKLFEYFDFRDDYIESVRVSVLHHPARGV